jgi:hypothetical protein
VAFNHQVFHRVCLDQVSAQETKKKPTKTVADAPTPGVKFVAWCFMVLAVVLFGLALLLLGVVLFSRHAMPVMAWLGNAFPTVDDVPGGRALLGWLGFFALAGAVIQFFVGVGLLNCVQGARRAVLVFAWLEILLAALGWLVVLVAEEGFWDIPVVAVALVVYFSRKDVRVQFEPASKLIEPPR